MKEFLGLPARSGFKIMLHHHERDPIADLQVRLVDRIRDDRRLMLPGDEVRDLDVSILLGPEDLLDDSTRGRGRGAVGEDPRTQRENQKGNPQGQHGTSMVR